MEEGPELPLTGWWRNSTTCLSRLARLTGPNISYFNWFYINPGTRVYAAIEIQIEQPQKCPQTERARHRRALSCIS
jgi:hypothetical protein